MLKSWDTSEKKISFALSFDKLSLVKCNIIKMTIMKNLKILSFLFLLFFTVHGWSQPFCDVRTFTIRDGLSANTISSINQTPNGLMWFSTWNGLCLYDGYQFTPLRNRLGMDDVLSTNRILGCKPSSNGNIWCITADYRVYQYNTHLCKFIDVSGIISKKIGHEVPIRNVYPLANGFVWLVSRDGTENYRINENRLSDNGEGIGILGMQNKSLKAPINKVVLGDDGREWICTRWGLECMSEKTKYHLKGVNDIFMAIVNHDTWLITSTGYLFVARKDKSLEQVLQLPHVSVSCLEKYGKDQLLVGTSQGIFLIQQGKILRQYSVQTPGQPSPMVSSLFVDSRKRVWAFTEADGVVMIDIKSGQRVWQNVQSESSALCTKSETPFIHEDSHGTLWLVPHGGTFSYYCESESKLKPYVLSANNQTSCVPYIKKYFVDRDNNLWFTSYRDVTLVNFRYRNIKFLPVLSNQEVRSLYVDSQHRMWVGMQNGEVAVFDQSRKLKGYLHPNGKLVSQPITFDQKIFAFHEDADHRIWIGTKGNGLYILSPNGHIEHYVHSDKDAYSLSHDGIYDIDTDSRGHTWIATYEGGLNLVESHDGHLRFIHHGNLLRQYPQSQYQKIRRITHTSDGIVLLSTTDGLISFSDRFKSPSEIHFYCNSHSKEDKQGLGAADVLQTLVTRKNGIFVVTLGGGVQKIVSRQLLSDHLRFTSLGQLNTDEGIIQSIAESNNGDIWMMRENSIVRCFNGSGDVLKYMPDFRGNDIEFSEAKPVHLSNTDIILVGARGGIVYFDPQRLKRNKYCPNIVFTSVLYQGDRLTEPVLNTKELDVPSDKRNFTVYFSAIEYTDRYLVKYAYKLEGIDNDWNYVGSSNCASFNHIPVGRHKLLVKSTNSAGVWVDNVAELNINVHPTFWETIWAKILYFILLGGIVYVIIYIYMLRAKNTLGREMSEMKTRFFTQIGHKLRTPLTLIGGPVNEVLKSESLSVSERNHLEMVKRNATQMLELVNRMLRYNKDSDLYISEDNIPITEQSVVKNTTTEETTHNIRLLVVEDNDDLRAFLVSILSADYDVMQAANGQQGLDVAERELPDFIITDVMMPVMDGLTMVRHIRKNNDICHIPIIVLSAKASLEDRIEGLKEGVDDYITKPFSAAYLKARVRNIISQRQMLQQTYVDQITPTDKQTYQLESPQIVDADKEMMNNLLDYMEKHLSDPNLKIEELADAVNLGRSVFYGKIKSIVGMTPVDFVRHIRMQRAQELVIKSNYPFSQIAYMVGFSDPKYFSKCFKKATGKTPSEYRNDGGDE